MHGDRWSIEFEFWDESVGITDVLKNGEQIPLDMISEDWLEKEEDRIECEAFGFQVFS
jgi:hypothetical protein